MGKGLVGAHWLIKVFVVLGVKWEMLQGCLSCWDCEAKALGTVWERNVCTGSGFLAIRRNTPEAFRERSGINAVRTMKTLAQLWLSVRRKREAAFHQIFFARVFYASKLLACCWNSAGEWRLLSSCGCWSQCWKSRLKGERRGERCSQNQALLWFSC